MTPTYPHDLVEQALGSFDARVRIPVSGSVPMPERVRKLIDLPEFQRLRGVRQLGPTKFVFPGATHTRFEHSIGVYALSLRYLSKLSSQSDFVSAARDSNVSVDDAIRLGVAAALLHDVGHYPYSHWIEEIKYVHDVGAQANPIPFENHERRAASVLSSYGVSKVLAEHWNLDPGRVSSIIVGTDATPIDALLTSMISSPLDCDKLDYIARDSMHCGVNYGAGIDQERIVHALVADADGDHLAVTTDHKGRSALMTVLAARNMLYREVYWHKTVRAVDAMFKRFFYELVSAGCPRDQLEDAFTLPDDAFVLRLVSLAEAQPAMRELASLITPLAHGARHLHKRVFTYVRASPSAKLPTRDFFDAFFKGDYGDRVSLSNALRGALADLGRIPSTSPASSILVDAAPVKPGGEKYKLGKLRIQLPRTGDGEQWQSLPGQIDSLNDFLGEVEEAHVFCDPGLTRQLDQRELKASEWNEAFRRALSIHPARIVA